MTAENEAQAARVPNMLNADKPITTPADDKLGYSVFASQLAHTLTTALPNDGFVVAINAAWGTGKTTLLNLIEYHINQMPEKERLVLLRFNPWWFAGQDLTLRFFQELMALTKRGLLSRVQKSLDDFAEAVSFVSATIPGYGAAVGGGAQIAKRFLKARKTTEQAKRELSEKLLEQRQRILVIVDDIDRLEPREVRALFQLIKAVADLPNLVYLLAFDKKYVAQALTQPEGLSGEDFLEKIVQASFDLPVPEPFSLQTMLLERLDALLVDTPDRDFDQERWVAIFNDSLRHLLATPRDIVRLSNTLSVSYPSVQGEVNPVDFISLECLRLFCSSAYEAIRENKEAFTGGAPARGLTYARELEKLRSFHNSWVERVDQGQRTHIKALIQRLFPKLSSIWGNGHEYEQPSWRTKRRVCHPDIYPVYFRLAVPVGQISRAEMLNILSLHDNPTELANRLAELSREKVPAGGTKAWMFFNMLEDYITELPAEEIPGLLSGLADLGDDVLGPNQQPPQVFSAFDMLTMVGRSRWRLLRRVNSEARPELLRRLVKDGKSLAVAVRTVVSLGSEHGRYGGEADLPDERSVTVEMVEELEKIALERIREVAKEGQLLDAPELANLLYRWRDWAGDSEPSQYLNNVIAENPANLRKVLAAFGWLASSGPRCDPRRLDPFLPSDKIIDQVRAIASNDPNAAQYVKEYEILQRGEDPDHFFR
jgi:predicted KAP-like P-loop ATPase